MLFMTWFYGTTKTKTIYVYKSMKWLIKLIDWLKFLKQRMEEEK